MPLARAPWITLLLIAACLAVHGVNEQRRAAIEAAAVAHCTDPGAHALRAERLVLTLDAGRCANLLQGIHASPARSAHIRFLAEHTAESAPLQVPVDAIATALTCYYAAFADAAPASLDATLGYAAGSVNPLRALGSALLHADRAHLLTNLLVLLAIGLALEPRLRSPARSLALFALGAMGGAAGYGLAHLGATQPAYLMGLSGAISGALAAGLWLLPWRRLSRLPRALLQQHPVLIPLWLVAAWLIVMQLHGALVAPQPDVASSAHLGGALAGVLAGALLLRPARRRLPAQVGPGGT
jgi:membrane associated rhomboid family serine protease